MQQTNLINTEPLLFQLIKCLSSGFHWLFAGSRGCKMDAKKYVVKVTTNCHDIVLIKIPWRHKVQGRHDSTTNMLEIVLILNSFHRSPHVKAGHPRLRIGLSRFSCLTSLPVHRNVQNLECPCKTSTETIWRAKQRCWVFPIVYSKPVANELPSRCLPLFSSSSSSSYVASFRSTSGHNNTLRKKTFGDRK